MTQQNACLKAFLSLLLRYQDSGLSLPFFKNIFSLLPKLLVSLRCRLYNILSTRLDRWSIFSGDVMVMAFLSKRCDTDVFWTNVTIASDVIIWIIWNVWLLLGGVVIFSIWLWNFFADRSSSNYSSFCRSPPLTLPRRPSSRVSPPFASQVVWSFPGSLEKALSPAWRFL